MNKFEVMISIGLFLLAFVGGLMIGKSNVASNDISNINVTHRPIAPAQDLQAEKIDMAYNIDTNQTYWKFPNETEWHLLK